MSTRGRDCTGAVTVGGEVIGVSTAAAAALDGGRLSLRDGAPADPQPAAHAAATTKTRGRRTASGYSQLNIWPIRPIPVDVCGRRGTDGGA